MDKDSDVEELEGEQENIKEAFLFKNEQKSKRNFYMKSRMFFITYTRAPEHWTKEFLQDYLVNTLLVRKYKGKVQEEKKGKTKVVAILVSEELHQSREVEGVEDYERGSKHYHCFIELGSRMDIFGFDFFNIEGVQANCQKVLKESLKLINYIKKEGNYTGFGFPGASDDVRQLLSGSTEDVLLSIMSKVNYMDRLKLRDRYLDCLVQKKNMEIYDQLAKDTKSFPFQKYFFPVYQKAGFFAGKPMALILYGEPNSGKSSFAYKIAQEWRQSVFTISGSGEKSFSTYKDEGIFLFDEMSGDDFCKPNVQSFLNSMITEPGAQSTAYCGQRRLSWPRKIIFTTNEDATVWKYNVGLKARVILIHTYANGFYEIFHFNDCGDLEKIVDFSLWVNNRVRESEHI